MSAQSESAAASKPKAEAPSGTNASAKATAIVAFVAVPLISFFALAVADGTTRASQAPLRAVLGNERFETLMAGGGGTPHYLGYERIAPDVSFETRDGGTWSLGEQRGKVVVLNFWSITCGPCIEEMPSVELLAQMVEQRFGDTVDVVAVSTDADWPTVAPRIEPRLRSSGLGPEYTLDFLFDADKSGVEGEFGTELYPETWIVDRDGVVRFRYDGARNWGTALTLDLIDLFR
ncbi:MAG: TlpA disulfide reductase family protein [Myxococcota bacterium]